ncbi:MAG: mraZ [Opitutae bacterium]|jgi:MraZ protein|nr:mraZ [Opitutae bacterium]MDG1300864.1 mraZ [Opitutae bacterium]
MGLFDTGGFIGEFRHSLDDKGRLTMPSAWRPKGGSSEDYFLALPSIEEGPEAFVSVLSPKRIALLEEKIDAIPASDIEGQRMVVELMSMAHQFSCDKQGRINLNDKLVQHAQIKKGAVLVGIMSTFNIYSEELRDAALAEGPSDPATRAAVFTRFGL